MQTAHILLSLGGDHGNTVPKFFVTAAEIAVLRAIHGDDAVKDIEPQPSIVRSNREERARLVNIYGAAKTEDHKPIVESMFPGVAARVFENIHELDLDESFFKAIGRLSATPPNRLTIGDPAGPSEIDPTSGPTISQYVAAGYKASAYPPTPYLSKSTPEEIAAAVAAELALQPPSSQAEPVDGADDSIGDDIHDEYSESNVLG